MSKLVFSDVDFLRGGKAILSDINLRLIEGRHYCLIGPNGAGKTTLLSLICGMEWPSRGTVLLHDERDVMPPPHAKPRFGHFFPRTAAWIEAYHPGITALELVTTGFHQALAYYYEASAEEIQLARSFLQQNVSSIDENREFLTFSTGERLRILLLRCLITRPDFVVLDEPFDGLDLPGRRDFEKLIHSVIAKNSRMSLTVLHRIEEIPEFITDVILLKQGTILAHGAKSETLTSQNLSNLYDTKLVCREHRGRYYVLYDD